MPCITDMHGGPLCANLGHCRRLKSDLRGWHSRHSGIKLSPQKSSGTLWCCVSKRIEALAKLTKEFPASDLISEKCIFITAFLLSTRKPSSCQPYLGDLGDQGYWLKIWSRYSEHRDICNCSNLLTNLKDCFVLYSIDSIADQWNIQQTTKYQPVITALVTIKAGMGVSGRIRRGTLQLVTPPQPPRRPSVLSHLAFEW